MAEAHARVAGGHCRGRATAKKVLCIGLWWLTLNGDAEDYARTCDVFQRIGKPLRRDKMPLVT